MEKIKFISYDGRYPNLCSGTLKLEVNGQKYELDNILYSRGFIKPGFYEVIAGEWDVFRNKLPKELEPFVKEITEIVNKNVPYGYCGGCI